MSSEEEDVAFSSFTLQAESCNGGGGPVASVEQVRCECCGLAEECTPEYIASVRRGHSGRWVCGLCAEAVKEELVRLRLGLHAEPAEDLEDALRAHIQFLAEEMGSPVIRLGAAMRLLLRRSLSHPPSSSSSMPNSPRHRPPTVSRTTSCIGSIPPQAISPS